MDNQNYVYPDIDSNFVGAPRDQNQLPLPYQGNNIDSLQYGSNSYHMTGGNIFPNDNTHSVGKTFHEDMVIQATGNDPSALASKGPEPTCSMLDMNMEKVNPVMFSLHNESTGLPSRNHQGLCSKFSSPTVLNDSSLSYAHGLQSSLHEPFVRNVSQPQEFSRQFGSREFVSDANVFLNSSSTPSHGGSVNSQPPLLSVRGFSSEHIDCNQTSKAYLEVNPTSEQNAYNNHTAALQSPCSENLIPRQNEFPGVNLEAYAALNVQDAVTTSHEAEPHLELNVGFPYRSGQEAEKLPQNSDQSSQLNPVVSTSVDKSLSHVFYECPQNSHSISETSTEETCSVTAKSNYADDVSSSLCLPADDSMQSNAKSESYCKLLPDNHQSSSDVTPNIAEAHEESKLSSSIRNSEIDTPVSGGNMEENAGESEKEFHGKNLCSNTSTISEMETDIVCLDKGVVEVRASAVTDAELNGSDTCFEKKSPNEKSTVQQEISADSSEQTDGKPLSPMIKVLNDVFGEETNISEEGGNPQDGTGRAEEPQEESSNYVRCTRARTGALPNKTRRFVDEFLSGAGDESSLDSMPDVDWEYEEGAEIAPSMVDPSVTVPEKVLQVTSDELNYYHRQFFSGVEAVLKMRLHCTSCGRHIGAAPNNIHLGNRHKVLRVLICNRCRAFYGLGKFPRDSDGSEFYCRWCGQGGQIICCSSCPNVFCESCIKRNFGSLELNTISNSTDWACYVCKYEELWHQRAICWALLTYTAQKKKEALESADAKKHLELEQDLSKCCGVVKNKKRKTSSKKRLPVVTPALPPSGPSHQDTPYDDSAHFGHFLFDNESPLLHQAEEVEEDDFIDPSQFVQSVLQEATPKSKHQVSSAVHQPPHSRGRLHPAPAQPQGIQVRIPHPTAGTSTPRIIIRQGNLMQPGLTPFNKQPNSIGTPGHMTVRNLAPKTHSASTSRPLLNNVDGVRSMDQMQALAIVPWFRDGLDNIRAVGFALTKRIRELEARFHTLKNKQDIEKVIKLGKKLERLSSKTESRFKQINSSLKVASKSWYLQRVGHRSTNQDHPFSRYQDNVSDWDDDLELSRPLEKVLIPMNSVALQQSSGMRPVVKSSIPPPPLVRTSVPPMVPLQRVPPLVPRLLNVRAGPAVPRLGNNQFQIRTVYSKNQLIAQPVRLPGPKSSAARYRTIPSVRPTFLNRVNVEKVNSLLNERNGAHNISVSITSGAKRKRQKSDSSDDSDVVVCPTIPELLALHNVKPCRVSLVRNDDLIVSFLENQQRLRELNNSCKNSARILRDHDVDSELNFNQEVDTVVADDVSTFNADNHCLEPAEEPCRILGEEMPNSLLNESLLPCHEDIGDGKEAEQILDQPGHPGTNQDHKTVEDVIAATVEDVTAASVENVTAATVEDVTAATVEDVTAATVEDVTAATVEDVTAATVEGVTAATVQDVTAATVDDDDDDIEIINEISQSRSQ